MISGQFHAYTEGKVLQCDLSDNNLIYDRKDGVSKGILNDWDMASLVDEIGGTTLSTARHRSGTVPFMAIDRLDINPPAHLYRLDFESFLYILIWTTIQFDIANKKRLPWQNETVI
jgi:hypothetical protein